MRNRAFEAFPPDGRPSKRLGARPMDGLFFVFALAALVGGLVSGFSGFAMGLFVSGVSLLLFAGASLIASTLPLSFHPF
ncbi:hypothetical protein [Bradyrhizobium sp. LA6.12]|uniref:hypothetical protein n=1 Tax=unclassified Bradyrhizobium TaxID=2631580 RepID=UPI003394E906